MELAPELSIAGVLLVGFVLGLQHAIEADHLAAVTTIVSEKRNLLTASLVGGLWGLGHTLSLFIVGAAVIFLKVQISESTEAKLEALVGGMLILLGINAIRKIFTTRKLHAHSHDHDGHAHAHFHAHDSDAHPHEPHHRLSPRSVIIGMVHGLAGSAALMLLILPTIDSGALALLYIAVFGVGSMAGMMAMSLLIGLPFRLTAGRFQSLNKGIRFAGGAFSFCLGVFIVYEKLVAGA
jgi:ABC-type nickel/cobalt efflux system permease component RcnA